MGYPRDLVMSIRRWIEVPMQECGPLAGPKSWESSATAPPWWA